MLEQSVLTPQQVESFARENYGIGTVYGVTPLPGNTAICRHIHTIEGDYVLKEFDEYFGIAGAEGECALTEFLRERDFPAVRFVRTLRNEPAWQYNGRVFHLHEYVDGRVYPQNAAPDWLVRESASLLGRLHHLLLDHPALKQGFQARWFEWSIEGKRRAYDGLIERAERIPECAERTRILRDLDYKRDSLERAARISIDPATLTQRNSHGDYHISQLVCGPEQVRAVIDFSSACRLPAIWEVFRSYTLAEPRCADGQVDVEGFKEYLRVYLEHCGEVTREDLAAIPRLYYLQLMRSVYGYREFLEGEGYRPVASRKLSELLKFGLWRTEMCRWLDQYGDDLSRDLAASFT